MHELFAQVLNKKDLSKAGDLFSLEDRDIKGDLISVLQKIGEIIDNKDYASNDNDQSVVEICVTRVTTAIRETESIEEHAIALVRLLELCQKHNLNPSSQEKDPPHAKIASDIMSCLFMHYGKGKVMILAIPVVVNFLCCNNKELGRNVSSYLSLAALDNADLLARHMDLILNSVLRGNYILSTVLPQIFTQCRQAVIDKTDRLVKIVDKCEPSERLSLFQVFGMIAKTDTKVLEKHVPKFVEYLSSTPLSSMILCLFVDMATANPFIFVDHVPTLQKAAEQQPTFLIQVIQIMGALATLNKDYARKSMEYFVSQFASADQTVLTVILQEIKALSLNNHDLLALNLEEISKLSQNGSSAVRILVQQLKEDNNKYSSPAPAENTKQTRSVSSQTEGTVTIITVGNPPNAAYPSGAVAIRHTALPPSNMSSQQSLTKSSRASASQARLTMDRPVSPLSSQFSDRLSMTSAMTYGSTQTGPPLPPEPLRDGVQNFCEKHMPIIRNFIESISVRIPLPSKCSIINGRHKRYIRLNFLCGGQGDQCLYGNTYFSLNTKVPKTWIHVMFLAVQAQSTSALNQNDASIQSLRGCWDSLWGDRSSFLTLVTSSFPSPKDQDILLQELQSSRFFDVFEFNAAKKYWACFMCNHPEKMLDLLQNGNPVIAGQLKEKKGRWKFLKRWKTRYFTLSGAQITYNKSHSRKETLPVSKIQSVKAVRKGVRDIPKAFEIFTGDQTYTFKAKGQQNIEQWVQCLHIAVARVQTTDKDKTMKESEAGVTDNNSMPAAPNNGEVSPQNNVVIERPRSVMDTKL
ncbi:protein melted-like [Ylistrum balloti]|uniref:protein melted-like n=1 Tax=Ylistrum balloti TaxID=509963 RepID=UPI0029058682|nr:protein melted-like [Ylistrum balloti]